jgi:hypothetical protein
MEKYFKEGMAVWDISGLKGVCFSEDNGGSIYPISVEFENGMSETYTYDGRYTKSDSHISLFQTKPNFPENVPLTE